MTMRPGYCGEGILDHGGGVVSPGCQTRRRRPANIERLVMEESQAGAAQDLQRGEVQIADLALGKHRERRAMRER